MCLQSSHSSLGVGGSRMSLLTDLAASASYFSGHFVSPPYGLFSSSRLYWAALQQGSLSVLSVGGKVRSFLSSRL
jgi:hypothetical protein